MVDDETALEVILCVIRGHRLDIGDTSDGHFGRGGRSFTSARYSNRPTADETGLLERTSRRGPRFNSTGTFPPVADCVRGTGVRGGRFGNTPRCSSSSDTTHQSSAVASSAADSQSKRTLEQVGTSQSASTAREHGLSSR